MDDKEVERMINAVSYSHLRALDGAGRYYILVIVWVA